MKEGDVSHEEANAAIAAADKTIIFARQNRLRDGLLLDDDKLRRFHAGHQNVRFFYSAVRQLPEYFLDALLARGISVTLVVDRGLLCFKDVRNWQAVHIGRTRRTVYLPERLLAQAVNNGYDYWSIAQVLVTEGWKLLDYVLLYDLVEAVRQMMLSRYSTVVGYATFRRLLREKNSHRSSYESPALKERRRRTGLDAPINELEEFLYRYEPGFLKRGFLEELKRESRVGRTLESDEYSVAVSSDAMAKKLYDEYYEELWARRKAAEIFEELDFPDFFLLDRDVVHPAAREMAEAAGQPLEPQSMAEARHDFRDCQRFGLGVELGLERFLEQAVQFGGEGVQGLMEEVVAPFYEKGRLDEALRGAAAAGLGRGASKPKYVGICFVRGLELARFCEVLRVWREVKVGARRLHLEDIDAIRSVAVTLAATRSGNSEERIRVINTVERVDELFANLRALIVGEAHRLLDPVVEADPRCSPPPWEGWEEFGGWTDQPLEAEERRQSGQLTVQQLAAEELEKAVVQLALCLDLAPAYQQLVGSLAARGALAEEVIEGFLRSAGQDPELQVVVVNARQALEAVRKASGRAAVQDLGEVLEDAEILGQIVDRVEAITGLLPERYHTGTSGAVSPLRRALREFEAIRRRHPTDPEQLAHLAMALVRLDRLDNYDELLDHIRWMRRHAVGRVVWKKGAPTPEITPGLLKVAEETDGTIGERARALAEELAETPYERLREPNRVA